MLLVFSIDFSQVRRNLDQAKTLLEALIKVLLQLQFQAYLTVNQDLYMNLNSYYFWVVFECREKRRREMLWRVKLAFRESK